MDTEARAVLKLSGVATSGHWRSPSEPAVASVSALTHSQTHKHTNMQITLGCVVIVVLAHKLETYIYKYIK